jgi:endo-1,4-beta-D-glucanase Y
LSACNADASPDTPTLIPTAEADIPVEDIPARRPFPQHVAYSPGTILPAFDRATMDQQVAAFYDEWVAAYLREGCGEGRYYVLAEGTGSSGRSISVSEGQGYGMIITALMAGHDSAAKTKFDGLYRFFRDHPSGLNPQLMAWNQVEGCESVDGPITASAVDGDMDIAYALLLADDQWGSEGAINYQAEALAVIEAILEDEINPNTHTILLGDWVLAYNDDGLYPAGTRSSDFMFGHLRAYAAASGDEAWNAVIDATYSIVETIQREHSPDTGLLPDFIQDVDTFPRPADPFYLEGENDGSYGYNACRDPWRIGLDVLHGGDERSKAALTPLNAWISAETGGDPSAIRSGYRLDGSSGPQYDYSDLSFVAPFGVSAMVDPANQEWLDAIWTFVVETSLEDGGGYYGNTLKMLSIIAMSGNGWEPG